MEELRKALRELGLSSYKIETYLSLLKIKLGTIQQIGKISNVPLCKLYENLKWLYEQGYISLILQKPLTYKANDPKIILKSDISKRKDKLDAIEKELDKFNFNFPEIEKDIVQITNTKEAFLKKMKESVVKSTSTISYIVKNWEIDAELLRLLISKRKKGVKIRALGPVNKETIPKIRWLTGEGIKVRNYNPRTTRFSIFDKKLVIIRLRKDKENYYSVWIQSDVLAEILENYFDMLWEEARQG